MMDSTEQRDFAEERAVRASLKREGRQELAEEVLGQRTYHSSTGAAVEALIKMLHRVEEYEVTLDAASTIMLVDCLDSYYSERCPSKAQRIWINQFFSDMAWSMGFEIV